MEPCGATHVALARDSLAAAAAYADGSLCLFGLEGAPCLRWKAPAPRPGAVAGLALAQRLHGTRLLVAYADGALLLLEGMTGKVAGRLQAGSGGSTSSGDPVCSLSVCPADSSLLMLCRRTSATAYKVHYSKSAGAQALASVVLDDVNAEVAAVAAPAAAVAASAPGIVGAWSSRHEGHCWLAGPARPGQLLLLDTATGAVVKTSLLPCAAPLTALAVPPGEALLAAGAADGSLLLLRADTEAWARMPAAHGGSPVLGLAFSSCGRWLYSGGSAATLVWDLRGETEEEDAATGDG